MAEEQAGQRIEGIEPSPLPTNVGMAVTEFTVTDGEGNTEFRKMVRVSLATPAGVAVVFFPPEEAAVFGKRLQEAGRLAQLGLEVVRNGDGQGPGIIRP